jgi:hypothetical protein
VIGSVQRDNSWQAVIFHQSQNPTMLVRLVAAAATVWRTE